MKTIGLLGGMSWESSLEYYQLLNEGVRAELGGLHSAKILMYSVDFEELVALKHKGAWLEIGNLLASAAAQLEEAGAECIILATNTMHKVAEAIALSVTIPFLHIADATANEIKQHSIQQVGLLGTRFTMEESFYKDRLIYQHGLAVQVPNKEERNAIHDIIYNELCLGQIHSSSREQMRAAISNLVGLGTEAIILGCTEIALLVKPEDSTVPLFDTTAIHARAAVQWAVGSNRHIKS